MEYTSIASLAMLARPSGAFAMVAIDQRESLRTMFLNARGVAVPDGVLIDFKLAVAERLAPLASAMLFDRHYSQSAFDAAGAASDCGRILASDALAQEPGGLVEDSDIDYELDPDEARERGAVALKLLLIWRGGATADRCIGIAGRFLDRCHRAGLLGVVEAIVRSPGGERWDRETSLIAAARQLGALRPDLYKCEVPYQGIGDESVIGRVCEEITAALPCPWVVLSQGVAIDDYPRAVEIACRAGASGFLAGRAIWSDTLEYDDYRAQLQVVSVPRLQRLIDIVNSAARPWQSDVGVEAPSSVR